VTQLTKRQRRVIRTGAANVADKYDLKPAGERRFRRAATRAIKHPGVTAKSREYRHTIVSAARTETTRKEAKGVKKVLRRADRAGGHKARIGSNESHRTEIPTYKAAATRTGTHKKKGRG
jgi:hypothetical protein